MDNIGNAYCNYQDSSIIKANCNMERITSSKFSENIFAVLLIAASFVSIWKAFSLVISFIHRMN